MRGVTRRKIDETPPAVSHSHDAHDHDDDHDCLFCFRLAGNMHPPRRAPLPTNLFLAVRLAINATTAFGFIGAVAAAPANAYAVTARNTLRCGSCRTEVRTGSCSRRACDGSREFLCYECAIQSHRVYIPATHRSRIGFGQSLWRLSETHMESCSCGHPVFVVGGRTGISKNLKTAKKLFVCNIFAVITIQNPTIIISFSCLVVCINT